MEEYDKLLYCTVFYKHYCLGVIVGYRVGYVVWSQRIELTIRIRTPNDCLTWLRDIRTAPNYSIHLPNQQQ